MVPLLPRLLLGAALLAAPLSLLAAAAAPAPEILTPPAPRTPRINGPAIFGVRPGSPFLYAIPATGERPMEFSAEGLPAGLTLDAGTGRITGRLAERGEHAVVLRAKNALGLAERKFRIVVGDRIALTPPMGWNSWNCWGGSVSEEKVLASARALVAKGLRDHGWTYINIDDGWQGRRGGEFGAIQPNSKFSDMKALARELHGMGLKLGIYSTPWRATYEGHVGGSGEHADGSYDWITSGDHNAWFRIGRDESTTRAKKAREHTLGSHSFATNDARQWAAWGVDYLKYDWFPNDIPHVEEMAKALRSSGRDIVYSLSNHAPFRDAADFARLAEAWRTTSDITDTWRSMSGIGFQQDRWAGFTGPGHWSDPDMLVVGQVGWGPRLHPTRLTPDEQYTHVSLWSLLAAPLLIGCDIAQMDDFTVGLLSNDEVIAVNQDPLGRQGTQVLNYGDAVACAKPLEDGGIAVGLFNRGKTAEKVTVGWTSLGLRAGARMRVRDLWRQKDLGDFAKNFGADVPPHGVVLVRLTPSR